MKSICYLVPYFGKLPKGFEMWLLSCKANPTINWCLITDDRTPYDYPKNFIVKYCTYDEVKQRIQNHFDFPVYISKPWKLCDFRPAYGEIFAEELKGFDFWGHCDMDLVFGNIRKFYTDSVLEKYEKIGFQGHSGLYKNTPEVNSRYKTILENCPDYREVFASGDGQFFDEVGICKIYDAIGIPYFNDTVFAHIDRFTSSFYLLYLPEEDKFKNHRQVFVWDNGNMIRYYLAGDQVESEEFMYLHTFSRPIVFKAQAYDLKTKYVIYPDVLTELKCDKPSVKFISRKGRCSTLEFYCKIAWAYRKKLTLKKIIYYLKRKANLAAKRGFN